MSFIDKLTASLGQRPEQLRAQEVRGFCSKVGEVRQIAEIRPRTHAKVVGIVQSIKFIPRPSASVLEIKIYDGTDHLTGVWFGRKDLPGAHLGKPIILQGTIQTSPSSRTLTVMNPAYELVLDEQL